MLRGSAFRMKDKLDPRQAGLRTARSRPCRCRALQFLCVTIAVHSRYFALPLLCVADIVRYCSRVLLILYVTDILRYR